MVRACPYYNLLISPYGNSTFDGGLPYPNLDLFYLMHHRWNLSQTLIFVILQIYCILKISSTLSNKVFVAITLIIFWFSRYKLSSVGHDMLKHTFPIYFPLFALSLAGGKIILLLFQTQ